MPLELPDTSTEVVQRAKTDVQRELPESNPFLKNSWIGALIVGYCNRVYDFYLQLKKTIEEIFPDTTVLTYLERWAAIWGVTRLAATVSSGNIVATGTATTLIPSGTTFASSDGKVYTSSGAATITTTVLSVSSITRSGTTATLTTTGDHGLASNVTITVAGAVETDYNVSNSAIQVTGTDTLTYEVSGSPSTPATGTITLTHTSIQVPVDSNDYGESQNQDLDAVLTVQSPISGLDDELQVDYGTISGGTDQETDDQLRLRFLDRVQNPIAHFNVAEITAKAKEIAGVTRVFVQEVTPANGQVTIYFMRDNDSNPIPTASDVTTVKNKILEIKPANTSDANVIVSAPTAVPTAFTFTAIVPNTSTMKAAVSANLQQFFDENTDVGVNIDSDAYRSAIYNTVDTETGDTVTSFTLSAPAGDITISTGEIGTLGTITYP